MHRRSKQLRANVSSLCRQGSVLLECCAINSSVEPRVWHVSIENITTKSTILYLTLYWLCARLKCNCSLTQHKSQTLKLRRRFATDADVKSIHEHAVVRQLSSSRLSHRSIQCEKVTIVNLQHRAGHATTVTSALTNTSAMHCAYQQLQWFYMRNSSANASTKPLPHECERLSKPIKCLPYLSVQPSTNDLLSELYAILNRSWKFVDFYPSRSNEKT